MRFPQWPTRNRRAIRAICLLALCLACVYVSIVGTLLGVQVLAVLAAIAGALFVSAELSQSISESREPPPEDLVSRLAREVESGRKLAIYDQDTGLYAKWYLMLRGEEELVRAKRYGRQLTLALIAPDTPKDGDRWQAEADASRWLQTHLRATDVVGYLGQGRYAFIAPETDRDGAARLAERLRTGIRGSAVIVRCYPGDGDALDDLWADAERDLSDRSIAA